MPSQIPKASRRSDGGFDLQHLITDTAKEPPPLSGEPEGSNPASSSDTWLDAFELPSATPAAFQDSRQIDDAIHGARRVSSLLLPMRLSEALLAVQQQGAEHSRPTKSLVCTLALAHALTHTRDWVALAPADKRRTREANAAQEVSIRHTVSLPEVLLERYEVLLDSLMMLTSKPPSLQSLKATGLAAGLSRAGEWRALLLQMNVR